MAYSVSTLPTRPQVSAGEPLRMTILAMELPYPANHGGRVDIWRRIKALKRLGVQVQLIGWSRTEPDRNELKMLQAHVTDFHRLSYPKRKREKLRRLVDLCFYPLEVTSRIVRGQQWQTLQKIVQDFQPHILMADQIHSALATQQLGRVLNLPVIMRSQNIEHLHYRELLAAAPDLKSKVARFLSQNHLERFERRTFERCLAVYESSSEDLRFWHDRGLQNGYLLPPIVELPEGDAVADDLSAVEYDAVFLGNLRTENNVAGVVWFLEQVLPLLRVVKPKIRVAIAGSEPTIMVQAACHRAGVTLIANPPDALAIYRSGRVCFNPVTTGRGVSVKSLDMLVAGRPIVSFAKGTWGLPDSVQPYFRVAPDAPSFAEAMLDSLNQPAEPPDWSLLVEELGDGVIRRFVAHVRELLTADRLLPHSQHVIQVRSSPKVAELDHGSSNPSSRVA